MNSVQRIVKIDKELLWFLGARYISNNGNEILIDPDTGIFRNGVPIDGGGGQILVDEILLTGLNKSIEMNTTDGLVFKSKPPNTPELINSFGEYGVRLDPTTTLQIGNQVLDLPLLTLLRTTLSNQGVTLPTNASIVIGDQVITRTSLVAHNAEIATLTSKVSTLEDEYNVLSPLPGLVASNQTRINDLLPRVTNLEGAVITNTDSISAMDVRIIGNTNTISSITVEQNRLSGVISAINMELGNVSTNVSSITSRVDAVEISVSNADTTAQSAQTTALALQGEITAATDQATAASTLAQDAKTESSDALMVANMAINTGLGAQTLANTAIDVADSAKTDAVNASSTANYASVNARNALDSVTALTTQVNDELGSLTTRVTAVETTSGVHTHDIGLLDSRVTNLENSGGPDPVVLPFFVETSRLNFGTDKTVVNDTSITLGAGGTVALGSGGTVAIGTETLTQDKIATLTAVNNIDEIVVDDEHRVVLFKQGTPNVFSYSSEPLTTIVNPEWVKPDAASFGAGTAEETTLQKGSLNIGGSILDKACIETVNDLSSIVDDVFAPGLGVVTSTDGVFRRVTLPDYITYDGLDFNGNLISIEQATLISNLFSLPQTQESNLVTYNPVTKSFSHQEKLSWIDETNRVIGNMGDTFGDSEAFLTRGGFTFGGNIADPSENTTLDYSGLTVVDKGAGAFGQRRSGRFDYNGILMQNPLSTSIDDPAVISIDRKKLALIQRFASVDVLTTPDTDVTISHRMLVADKFSGNFTYVKPPQVFSYLKPDNIQIGDTQIAADGVRFTTGTAHLSGTSLSLGDSITVTETGFVAGGINLNVNGITLTNDIATNTLSFDDLVSLKTNFVGAANAANLTDVDPGSAIRFLTKPAAGGAGKWLKMPSSFGWLKDDSISADNGTNAISINPDSTRWNFKKNEPLNQIDVILNANGMKVNKINLYSFQTENGLTIGNIKAPSMTNPYFPNVEYKINRDGAGFIQSITTDMLNIPSYLDSVTPYTLTCSNAATGGLTYRHAKVSEMIPNTVIQPSRNPTATIATQLSMDGVDPKPAVLDAAGLSFPDAGGILDPTSTQSPHDGTTLNSNFLRIGKPGTPNSAVLKNSALHLNNGAVALMQLTMHGLRFRDSSDSVDTTSLTNGALKTIQIDVKQTALDPTFDARLPKITLKPTEFSASFQAHGGTIVRSLPSHIMLANRYSYYQNTTGTVFGENSTGVTKQKYVRGTGSYMRYAFIDEAVMTSTCLDFGGVGDTISFSYALGTSRPVTVAEVGFVTRGDSPQVFHVHVEQQGNFNPGYFLAVPYSAYTGTTDYYITNTIILPKNQYWISSAKIIFFPADSSGSGVFNGKVRFQLAI